MEEVKKQTADKILSKHEDANEMHLFRVHKNFVIEAMEEYAKYRLESIKCMRWLEFKKEKPNISFWCLIANEACLTIAWWNNEKQIFENVNNIFLNPPVWFFPIEMPNLTYTYNIKP